MNPNLKVEATMAKIFLYILSLTILLSPLGSWAQPKTEEEKQKKIESIGRLGAFASRCDQESIAPQFFDVGDGVVREWGTDAAFQFMIVYGANLNKKFNKKKKCPHYLAAWKEFYQKYKTQFDTKR